MKNVQNKKIEELKIIKISLTRLYINSLISRLNVQ